MNEKRRSIETILRKLDCDDLLYWAGEKIVNRGKSYVEHVNQLARTATDAPGIASALQEQLRELALLEKR